MIQAKRSSQPVANEGCVKAGRISSTMGSSDSIMVHMRGNLSVLEVQLLPSKIRGTPFPFTSCTPKPRVRLYREICECPAMGHGLIRTEGRADGITLLPTAPRPSD